MLTPSRDRGLTQVKIPKEIPMGLDATAHWVCGAWSRRSSCVEAQLRGARQVDTFAGEFERLSQHALETRLGEYAAAYRLGRAGDELLFPALAAIREMSNRRLKLFPHLVQVAGALALHRGYLIELATGEGKTLVAAMAAVIAGWRGRPCHIVTANDYLAERDAEWMSPLYKGCGVSVGYVTGATAHEARRKAYGQAVAYTTSKELVADFLRDRLALGRYQHYGRRKVDSLLRPGLMARFPTVLRGLHTAIVDEADHILVDEAVTPVILSSPHENSAFEAACLEGQRVACSFVEGVDFAVEVRQRRIELLEPGRRKVEQFSEGMEGLWRAPRRSEELITTALEAVHLYQRGRQYVVDEEKVVIVDEFTGRLMPQRTWREGLHQAVEVKEGLPPSQLSETSMRLSFQRFFRFFEHLSGMTGTAREASGELWGIYRLPVICLPTHRPVIREQRPSRYFASEEEKWHAVVEEILCVSQTGRPVLVGVRTVGLSEQLSRRLEERGVAHSLLNATMHREEAQIISRAGREGQITIATNMAGRGTDIMLGSRVADRGGLHVVATEFHEDARIDRQLYGRSGRQGDPGSAITFASLEDELFVRRYPAGVRSHLSRALGSHAPWSEALVRELFAAAQRTSRSRAFGQRRQVLKTDSWLEESLSFAGGHAL